LIDRLREEAKNASTRRSRERPAVSMVGETCVVREADQGCQLDPPAGSTEAPGATE
jgi:hypothetical protein